ncbi:DsbA family protein [Leucobacter sp. 1207-22]|uniref:DsbA family protein n=1 Tax=Leucobacter sp. 1207-22 TaxID=2604456 RepID=UPI0040638AF0
MSDTQKKLTKNERREQAREQARKARAAEKRREKRSRLFIQGGVVVGIIAILAIVGVVISTSMKPAGPGPENMATGGIIFGKDLEVVKSKAMQDPTSERKAPEVERSKLPIDMTIYVDYMCPACGAFEGQYGSILEQYVGSGDVQLQVYPVTFLDPQSSGTRYSTRAANLMGCVVEQQPEFAFKLHNTLLSEDVQPAEGSTGLTDQELLDVAKSVGVDATSELKNCMQEQRFRGFFDANYSTLSEYGVPGLADGARLIGNPSTGELQPEGKQALVSTPTVIVNGQQWSPNRDGDLEQYILKLKSEIEQQAATNETATAE